MLAFVAHMFYVRYISQYIKHAYNSIYTKDVLTVHLNRNTHIYIYIIFMGRLVPMSG